VVHWCCMFWLLWFWCGWVVRLRGSSVGRAGRRLDMCIQFCAGAWSAIFCAPGWSSTITFSIVSCVRSMGSWLRAHVSLLHHPQNVKQQQVSFGTPTVFMRAVMFWLVVWSTWVRGVPGAFFSSVCWSLYRLSGR